jgi:hypothetical protein
VPTFAGRIFLERARDTATGPVDPVQEFSGRTREQAISYQGPDVAALRVRFEDVRGPGLFRAVLEHGEPIGRVEAAPFVVQAP